MIADKDTNTVYFSSLLEEKYPKIWIALDRVLKEYEVPHYLLEKTNDIWARDYMPIQISKDKFIEYRYDPDYLQGNSENIETRELKTYPDIVCDTIRLKTIKTDIIIDGGNVVKSENAIILTDKVVWENKRHYSEKQLIKELHDLFEVDKVVLIPWDEECEYGHADGMLRFINNETVLISGFYNYNKNGFMDSVLEPLKQNKLNWEWLDLKKEKEDNIAYINFLQTKDIILLPKLGKEDADKNAYQQIKKHYVDSGIAKNIAQVKINNIVRHGGALNCISWTIKK